MFTGRFFSPPVEVLFDRICRENGIEHLLTKPRSPTTTGKIERFHRTLRAEFDTTRVFGSLRSAQAALDEWVGYYNTERPHQALDFATPASRFERRPEGATDPSMAGVPAVAGPVDRAGDGWVTRKVASNGVVCVDWQQVSLGKHRGGEQCDVFVTDQLIQFWIGSDLVKTVQRNRSGEVRKKHAIGTGKRS